ncbi:toll/interleukin-1 receptor domain-containing protein [Pantoea sp.]|uniref:toll/interleukin-1 receptor domain-containing protein n=1 Tax=Pantoea TaxID=53335 RepID=UPI0025EA7B55|nr:toll/interleukin-1 receptor domain-containing protein [Pantoea sp.]
MKLNKIIYIGSFLCVLFGAIVAFMPYFFDFLNGQDEKTLNYIFAFSLSYVGLAVLVVFKIREKRKLRLNKINKVFLVYSPNDLDKVSPVAHKLKELGFEIWFSAEDLLPGQIINKKIQSVLDDSFAAILFASSSGFSEFGEKEIDYLLKNRSVKDDRFIPILPVLMEGGTLPPSLQSVMFIRYEDDKLIDKLAESLNKLKSK